MRRPWCADTLRDDFNALKRGVEERETALHIKLNAARAGAAAASDALPRLQQDLAARERELASVARSAQSVSKQKISPHIALLFYSLNG